MIAAHTALLAGGIVVLFLLPPKGTREPGWTFALVSFACASTAAASLALGVPLLRRRTMPLAAAGVFTLPVIGLMFVSRFDVDPTGLKTGLACFATTTAIAAVGVIGLAVSSRSVMRRFPRPVLILAVAVTAVGLVVLHFRCDAVDAPHLFGFHLAPIVVMYGAARLALRR